MEPDEEAVEDQEVYVRMPLMYAKALQAQLAELGRGITVQLDPRDTEAQIIRKACRAYKSQCADMAENLERQIGKQ